MSTQEPPEVLLRLIAIIARIAEALAEAHAGTIRKFLVIRPAQRWCEQMREALLRLADTIEPAAPNPAPAQSPREFPRSQAPIAGLTIWLQCTGNPACILPANRRQIPAAPQSNPAPIPRLTAAATRPIPGARTAPHSPAPRSKIVQTRPAPPLALFVTVT